MKFPEKAFIQTNHPHKGQHGPTNLICVKRGESGFWPVYIEATAEELNARIGVSKFIADEMYICSLTGVWPKEPEPIPDPRPAGPTICGAKYVGPLSLWKGKTAMLHNMVLVQFDDKGQYTGHGWHMFPAADWKVPEMRTLHGELASANLALAHCKDSGNKEWHANWEERIVELMDQHAPRGSGFDSGTLFDFDASSSVKLVFQTSFHHMDANGGYDGWTEHQVIATPSFTGINIRVTGSNRNDIRDFIAEVFHDFLNTKVAPYGH